MRYASSFKQGTQPFRFFDGNGSYKNRLTSFIPAGNIFHYLIKFGVFVFIDQIRKILSYHRSVCIYHHGFKSVNVPEFSRFSHCGTGHSSQFFIHPEIILNGNRSKRLIFIFDLHSFLSLYSLMKTFAVSSARHQSACKLINNDYLAIFQHIIHIFFK